MKSFETTIFQHLTRSPSESNQDLRSRFQSLATPMSRHRLLLSSQVFTHKLLDENNRLDTFKVERIHTWRRFRVILSLPYNLKTESRSHLSCTLWTYGFRISCDGRVAIFPSHNVLTVAYGFLIFTFFPNDYRERSTLGLWTHSVRNCSFKFLFFPVAFRTSKLQWFT